jgi:hypothetical protein
MEIEGSAIHDLESSWEDVPCKLHPAHARAPNGLKSLLRRAFAACGGKPRRLRCSRCLQQRCAARSSGSRLGDATARLATAFKPFDALGLSGAPAGSSRSPLRGGSRDRHARRSAPRPDRSPLLSTSSPRVVRPSSMGSAPLRRLRPRADGGARGARAPRRRARAPRGAPRACAVAPLVLRRLCVDLGLSAKAAAPRPHPRLVLDGARAGGPDGREAGRRPAARRCGPPVRILALVHRRLSLPPPRCDGPAALAARALPPRRPHGPRGAARSLSSRASSRIRTRASTLKGLETTAKAPNARHAWASLCVT